MSEEFYFNKTILITGSSGFVGKVLLEKILFSLPKVRKIYLILRAKEGKTVQDRLKEVLASPCFERINFDLEPDLLKKIQPIQGDLSKPDLDLSETDKEELIGNVNIILNVAAYTNLRSSLARVLESNTLGSLRVLELAKRCPYLISFVHVSTAYVNALIQKNVQEAIYPLEEDPQICLKRLLSLTNEELEKETKKILKRFMSTYSFSKYLCEQIIAKEQENIPLCIVRPTIITAALQEPAPGWIEKGSPMYQLYASVGLGLIHIIPMRRETIIDLVPVDIAANCIILAALYLCEKEKVNIIHLGSSERNPINCRALDAFVNDYFRRYPSESRVSNVETILNDSYYDYKVSRFFRRTLKGLFLGCFYNLSCKKCLKSECELFFKVNIAELRLFAAYQQILFSDLIFRSTLVDDLLGSLNSRDMNLFNVDISKIQWNSYIFRCMQGIKKYVFKEKVNSVSESFINTNHE